MPGDASQIGASTRKAGKAIDEGKGRTFPCRDCGGDLVFHIGQQSLKCPFCGAEQSLAIDENAEIVEQDFHEMLERLREQHERGAAQTSGQKEVQCSGCGGTTVFVGSLTTSECPYCGTPIQLEGVHDAEDRIPVDGVLPFLVDHDKAAQNLAEWVNSRWFAPNDFKKRGAEGKFNGVYLPYWTFDSLVFTVYHGERGEEYTVTVGSGDDERQETRVNWYPANGAFQRFFDDVLVLASPGMNRKLMQALEPWPLHGVIPFTQEVLAGYMARTYEVELEPGFLEARDRMGEEIAQEVRERIGGDRQRVHDIDSRHDAITFKHLLLPVWLLAYQYREKTYQVMINAGTGEVQGERPWSWIKITLTALVGIAVIVGIVLLVNR